MFDKCPERTSSSDLVSAHWGLSPRDGFPSPQAELTQQGSPITG